jgi:hypothetical protein
MSLIPTEIASSTSLLETLKDHPSTLHKCTAGTIERELATIAAEARARLWPQTPTTGPGQAIKTIALPDIPRPEPGSPVSSCLDLEASQSPRVDISFSYNFCRVDLLVPCKSISLHELARIICQRENITEAQLRGPQRTGHVCEARAIFCYLTHMYGNKTSTQIGMFLGDRDHTTIIHARDKIMRKKKDPDFSKKIAKYEKLFPQFTGK